MTKEQRINTCDNLHELLKTTECGRTQMMYFRQYCQAICRLK